MAVAMEVVEPLVEPELEGGLRGAYSESTTPKKSHISVITN